MPAKSKQQFKYIHAMRNKYKTVDKAPDNMKWIFDDEWFKDVDYHKLPNKANDDKVLNFTQWKLFDK